MVLGLDMCCETAPKQLLQPKNLHHNLCKLSLMQLPNHFCFIKVQGPQSFPDTPKTPMLGFPKHPQQHREQLGQETATTGGTKWRTEVRFSKLGEKWALSWGSQVLLHYPKADFSPTRVYFTSRAAFWFIYSKSGAVQSPPWCAWTSQQRHSQISGISARIKHILPQ